MSNQMLMYMMIGIGVLFAIIVLAYILISKKLNSSETREIQKLRQGTQAKKFTAEVLYQKLYVIYRKIPFIKRYILKLRRRLEIINVDDEYNTRKVSAKILTKALVIIVPLIVVTICITYTNYLLMFILYILT